MTWTRLIILPLQLNQSSTIWPTLRSLGLLGKAASAPSILSSIVWQGQCMRWRSFRKRRFKAISTSNTYRTRKWSYSLSLRHLGLDRETSASLSTLSSHCKMRKIFTWFSSIYLVVNSCSRSDRIWVWRWTSPYSTSLRYLSLSNSFIRKILSIVTLSRRTSCLIAKVTLNWSTSGSPSSWLILDESVSGQTVAHQHTPPLKSSLEQDTTTRQIYGALEFLSVRCLEALRPLDTKQWKLESLRTVLLRIAHALVAIPTCHLIK